MDILFSLRDLRFLDILSYPDMDFPAGRRTFLRGESGSGKSALLRLLNGSLSPSAGQVFYKGQDIMGLDSLQLRRQAIPAGSGRLSVPGQHPGKLRPIPLFPG